MSERTSVALIEDSDPVAELIRGELKSAAGIDVIGRSSDGQTGIELVAAADPDVVLIDLGLPDRDGMEVLVDLVAASTRARILVLTVNTDRELVEVARRAGAVGYLDKGVLGSGELAAAIRAVASGERWFPAEAE